jgi:hypothetical protein
LPSWFLDDEGNPLWDDINPEMYLAPGYSRHDLGKLLEYGLEEMTFRECLDRIQADFAFTGTSRPSRYQDILTSNSWHDRAAQCFSKLIDLGNKQQLAEEDFSRLKSFPLLPTHGGYWTSVSIAKDVYLPWAGDVLIPARLGLHVIAPYATTIEARVELFEKLGVEQATVPLIRHTIPSTFGSLPSSLQHLQFMYLTHGTQTDEMRKLEMEKFRECYIYDDEMKLRSPWREIVYMPVEASFGQTKLLGTKLAKSSDLPISRLHESYIANPPSPKAGQISWQCWLAMTLQIRTFIRLVGEDGKLSEEFRFVAERWPERIVYVLCDACEAQSGDLGLSPEIIQEIACLQVRCEGGQTTELSRTYLPLEDLIRQAEETLGAEGSSRMTFLLLENDCDALANLGFLCENFSVGEADDLDFYVDLLDIALDFAPDEKGYRETILGVYVKMQKRCEKFSDPEAIYETIQ